MNKLKLICLFVLLTFTSCEKEDFPEKNDLIGTWIEQTEKSFKHKLIFEEETLYFFKQNYTDTLFYRLDKNEERLYLSLKNSDSAGESNHKILLNKKTETLTIWGLFPSIPENFPKTVFKKN